MLTVILLGGMVQAAAQGAESIETEAKNIRQLLRNIGEQYPKIADMINNRQLSVSIDGTIFQDDWQQALPENAEICILPRIAGG